jgi:LmbE family N-acetylglucosaminyl deacetylase
MTSYLAPEPNGAVSRDLPVPERALAIGAHPDDIDFGCGATLAKWAAAGCEVFELVLTDGSKGSWDPDVDRSELIAIRQGEQRAAAARLGAVDVRFLDHVDGELQSGLPEREEVCRMIRELRPDVVLGHDPWRLYRLHPDHRQAGFLAVEGIVAARDPHFFPGQGLAPHRPISLLLWEAQVVDHLEDVDGYLEAKIEALLCHQSQWVSTMAIGSAPGVQGCPPGSPEAEREAFEARVRERAGTAGEPAGLGSAEAFKLLDRL